MNLDNALQISEIAAKSSNKILLQFLQLMPKFFSRKKYQRPAASRPSDKLILSVATLFLYYNRGANTRLTDGQQLRPATFGDFGRAKWARTRGAHTRSRCPDMVVAWSPKTHSPRSTFCTADGPKCRYP